VRDSHCADEGLAQLFGGEHRQSEGTGYMPILVEEVSLSDQLERVVRRLTTERLNEGSGDRFLELLHRPTIQAAFDAATW
jgi:hypothetical protein